MRIFFLISLILAGVFIFYPELDMKFTRLFYREDAGFFLKNNSIVQFFYHLVPAVTKVIVGGLVLFALVINIRKTKIFGLGNREVIYLFLVLALGPGLIVHTLFKDQWGRARPSQIVEFGGQKEFSPAFIINDQCEKNCSFVSGHAAAAFYLIVITMLMKRRRNIALSLAISYGIVVSFVRIVQGGHFLSDTIFAGIFTMLTAYCLHRLIYREREKPL